MKKKELKVYKRETLGKRETQNLRNEGFIPGVIYDNSQVTHIYTDYKPTKQVVFTPETYIVELREEGGETIDAIVREVQYHPVRDTIEHIEFLRVAQDREVILTLPVKIKGTAAGVTKGGKLTTKLRKLRVKGVPYSLPDFVEVDVTKLELGATIKVGEANIKSEGMKIVTPESAAVASIEIPRTLRSKQGQEAEK